MLLYFKQSTVCLETLDGDQIVYKRIVDQLDDLQRSHQQLMRTAESGVREDPKPFESKQKGILTMSTRKGPSATPLVYSQIGRTAVASLISSPEIPAIHRFFKLFSSRHEKRFRRF